ncbi:MAG: acyl-CoA thioesterase [Caulobacteraceae bacterium]|nr:acyl-CoA thioesterase [Caulobacter sp.]RYF92195.1 MAG: acyl-CoA thioesterase [Caulobacteraceae bacterium]
MKAIVTATTTAKPQFYDIDSMNIVWHGYYPKFMELGRVAILDKIDYGYEQMVASGYGWPIIDMRFRYARPMRLHQEIEIVAGITEWENRLKIDYEFKDLKTGQRLNRCSSVQVAIEIETETMLWETPPILREKLAPFLSAS